MSIYRRAASERDRIRMSLARRRTTFGMMMRRVAFDAARHRDCHTGLMALAGYIRSQLYGIEPGDPLHIAAAALFLLAMVDRRIYSRRGARFESIRSGCCARVMQGEKWGRSPIYLFLQKTYFQSSDMVLPAKIGK